jgi:hypothetical protein
LGITRAKRAGQRSRTVHEDWLAWIPAEMDELFGVTRHEMESSNFILSVSLDEALALCKRREFVTARDRVKVVKSLFDRLAVRLNGVVQAIKDHGFHFGTLPNVTPLSSSNFRGSLAQRIALKDSLLARVLFRERTRFFHKLDALGDIVEGLQKQADSILAEISAEAPEVSERDWLELEVIGYDLNTCMGETTIVLKSFFCALPPEELEVFGSKLGSLTPLPLDAQPGAASFSDSE